MPAKSSRKVERLRVKNEPPTLEEAMVAAACMSDDLDQQLEIAAGLMGITLQADTIRAFKAARPKGNVIEISSHNGPARAVLVEKKRSPRTFARPGQVNAVPRAGRA